MVKRPARLEHVGGAKGQDASRRAIQGLGARLDTLEISGTSLADGQIVTGQDATAASPITVTHTLGRAPAGVIILLTPTGSTVLTTPTWAASATVPNTELAITHGGAGTGTFDLWIF